MHTRLKNFNGSMICLQMERLCISLRACHIQDHNIANTTLEQHWGYPSRVVPCTNDEGTCQYLRGVYWTHDMSMLYNLFLWSVLSGMGLVWISVRGWRMGGPAQSVGSIFDKLCDQLNRFKRRSIKDAPLRWLFGRVSRLQVLILACLSANLY